MECHPIFGLRCVYDLVVSTVSDFASFITRTEPVATVSSAVALSKFSTQLNGTMNAHGSDTQVFFDYGTDPNNLLFTAPGTPVATGYGDTPVSVVLSNLPAGTYYYRVRGTSLGGVGTSTVGSFNLASISGLNRVTPGAAPDAQGFLFVSLTPANIGAGWRFVGES